MIDNFNELVNVEAIKTLFNQFSTITKIGIALIEHPSKKVIFISGWEGICEEFHRKSPDSFNNCFLSDVYTSDDLVDQHNIKICMCKNGLIHGTIPIIINDRHIATIITGQVLLEKPDINEFKEQAKKYGFDERIYIERLQEVPVILEKDFKEQLLFLKELSNIVAEIGLKNLSLKNLNLQQKEIFLNREEELKYQNEELTRKKNILNSINTLFLETLTCDTLAEVGTCCLSLALELTKSKFGLIGEVNEHYTFDVLALNDPGWHMCRIPREKAIKLLSNMEIKGLWGKVINEKKSYYTNDPATVPESTGIPEGHPEINTFMGVALKYHNKTIGMIALANKENGYDNNDLESIELLSAGFVEALYRKKRDDQIANYQNNLEKLVKERTNELQEQNKQLQAKEEELVIQNEDLQALNVELEQAQEKLLLTQFSTDNSSVPKFWIESDGRFSYVNKAACRSLGYSIEELMSLHIFDISKEYNKTKWEADWQELEAKKNLIFETELIRKDKSIMPVQVVANYFNYGGKKINVTNIFDLTERKVFEETLKENELIYRSLLNNLPQKIFYKDRNSVYLICNESYASDFGLKPEDMKGKNDYEFFPSNLAERYRGDDREVMELKQISEFDEPYMKEGKEYFIHTTKVPIINEYNQSIGILGIFWDVTTKVLAERGLKQLLEDLERSNKELEQFAYVASHDLQEPLRMITSYVQLLQKRYKGKLDEEADEFIGFAVDGASRMKVLINDLLTYSRIGTRDLSPENIDSNALVDQALVNLKYSIENSNAIINKDNLPVIKADIIQMIQLFQNLIGNAIKFSPDKQPEINISAQQINNYWQFSIKDNGMGISSEYYDKIFEIFQSLHGKTKYGGTGIGLAICKKILERHHGKIWVESELGKGSIFYFTIPL